MEWLTLDRPLLTSSPIISEDGTIYVESNNGFIYVIKSDSMGLANSPWPAFGHDTKRASNSTKVLR